MANQPFRPSWARLARSLILGAACLGLLLPLSRADGPEPVTVSLAAEGQQEAPNDLAVATLFVESSDSQPGTLARRVNSIIATAIAQAKKYPDVKVRTASSQTYPVYGKSGRTIEAWRMRSDLRLESRNLGALAELVGLLQKDLALSEIALQPAPDTRVKAQDDATRAALVAFQERAGLISSALGKRYRLKHLDVGSQGMYPPPRPMPRLAMAEVAAAPIPVEAGASTVTASVSGTIELID
ncbi:MAG: SIMPL domain-containing protein [Zoogloeaceae bacterium]|nr:SIMPL domain-containing protein [Zoogloeaceae bacterium]